MALADLKLGMVSAMQFTLARFLTVLIWRLRFEIKNLDVWVRRSIRKEESHVWYFGYGANVSDRVLARRGIQVLTSMPYCMHGFRMEFSNPNFFYCNVGDANLIKEPGQCVYGRLMKVPRTDLERMDFFEGKGIVDQYERHSIQLDGKEIFYYVSKRPDARLRPAGYYLKRICNYLKEQAHAPESYVSQFNQHPRIDSPEPIIRQLSKRLSEGKSRLLRRILQLIAKVFVSMELFLLNRSLTSLLLRR